MYRGFRLSTKGSETILASHKAAGQQQIKRHKQVIENRLAGFTIDSGTLNATELEEKWFPDVEAHVFISHSHKDASLAIGLAGWLQEKMGVTAFIDSCVWGYSHDLLRVIDNTHCLDKGKNIYNYKKRNQTTSHIHMLLMVALTKMIDRCECCLVLNTPSAISVGGSLTNVSTYSPWIYAELETMRLIRKNPPARLRASDRKYYTQAKGINESLQINYQVSLGHLESISFGDLQRCAQNGVGNPNPEARLNALYSHKPLTPQPLHG